MTTSTNYTDLAYIKEGVEGETPDTPQFQLLPSTGGSPVANITTAVSDVIRADRQTDDLTVVDSDITGDVNYELSYEPYKPFMTSLLENDTPTEDINITAITAVGATSELSKASIETLLEVGDHIDLSSVAEPDINGSYTVTVLGIDLVTVSPALPIGAAAVDVVAFASISVVGATAVGASDLITNAGIEAVISVGDVFSVVSASESAKVDGVYTCINNSVADQITIYPSFPDNTAAATDLIVHANTILTNGADTPDSYTFRKRAVNDSLDYFWYYRGCKVNTMSFEFSTGSILKGSFGIVGLTEEPRDTVLTGEAADLEVPAYDIMNSVTSIGSIYLGGVTLGKCSFSSLNLSIDNQINTAKSLGVLGACASAAFSLQVTASVEIYFENLDLYNKFKEATSFGITLLLQDISGNIMGINLPKCKFETLNTPIDGKDSFLMQSGTIRALRDATVGANYMTKFSFASA